MRREREVSDGRPRNRVCDDGHHVALGEERLVAGIVFTCLEAVAYGAAAPCIARRFLRFTSSNSFCN